MLQEVCYEIPFIGRCFHQRLARYRPGAHRMRQQCPAIQSRLVEATDYYQEMRSRRWARTSLHRVLPLPTMAYMWVAAMSCTTEPSHVSSAGCRWKRFLWLSLRTDTRSSPDLTPRRVSIATR